MSETLNITGKVKVIMDEVSFPSGFSKREFVVTIDEDSKYPQDIKLELVKDKCSLLDAVNEGDTVDVGYNLQGNEYNGKYYPTLRAWKINCLEAGAEAGSSGGQEAPSPEAVKDDMGDIPF